MAYKSSSIGVFLIRFLLVLLIVNAKISEACITRTQIALGAVIDMRSRAGKEARVAMEIAIDDLRVKRSQNVTLYVRTYEGDLIGAIREATYLIDSYELDAFLGLQTMEEVLSIGEIGSKSQIPTFSLLDSIPQRSLDRFPFLFQASPSQFSQTKAFVSIMESCKWSQFTFIYEDISSAATEVIHHLMETIKESGVQMSSMVKLSPLASSASFVEELERINKEQCRVFLVHASLETGVRLLQNAKTMGMMEKGYVWITTNLLTDLLHTVNSSTFSMMEGVVGIGSFVTDTSMQFHNFSTKFQTRFKLEYPEEASNVPGIFAVQAYDATWIAALALSQKNTSGKKLSNIVSSISFAGINGEVQIVNQRSTASRIFRIVNVIGKYYREVGFWSEGLGFSEVVNDKDTYDTSLRSLGHIFWPGRPLHTPRGWDVPTEINPLKVGVPAMAVFKKFVEVKYDHRHHNYTFGGYSVELFKEMVRQLPYYLSYEFYPFNGTYDSLVEQVYLKKFDAVVGDVSVISRRYQYAEFTHPYTETGLMMVVPVVSHHEQMIFVKPFTIGMWALTITVYIYNGFVLWLMERKHSPELQGSALNQAGILLCVAFTRIFALNGDQLNNNLTRMITVAWLFVAIIIGQCYSAGLTSMLTVRRLAPKVADYETLKNLNAIVGYGRGAHVASYLVDVLGFKNENIRSFTSPKEYVHALKGKEIAAVFLEAPFTKLFLAKYCKSFTVAATFGEGGFAFVLPKGSLMLTDFTKALLNVSESGTLQNIEKRMLGSEHCVEMESVDDEYGRMGLGSFWFLFLLTGGTTSIALAIHVIINCEIISKCRDHFVYMKNQCVYC